MIAGAIGAGLYSRPAKSQPGNRSGGRPLRGGRSARRSAMGRPVVIGLGTLILIILAVAYFF
jgi:hypothetical protein